MFTFRHKTSINRPTHHIFLFIRGTSKGNLGDHF
nr:MAG TPA: hypothetical protein [Caudoviricetes sp.]